MANRHKAQAKSDGGVKKAALSFGNKDVVSEAKKTGDEYSVAGKKGKARLDKRARGGRIGYKSPFSSARC